MKPGRLFDQLASAMNGDEVTGAANLLAGTLCALPTASLQFAALREELRAHRLHALLLEDPHSGRAFAKPRGYAGDAELIDYYYDRNPPEATSDIGRRLFAITTGFSSGRAVDFRRSYAAQRLERAHADGKRVCALACGHWREADGLIGFDCGNLTGIDHDPVSLDLVRERHGSAIGLVEANVFHYLRRAARRGEQFDLVYTLGLTDYFDERQMSLFYRLMRGCLAPGGEIMVANFLPDHLAIGWMDAVMDWHLVYRSDNDMLAHAEAIGLRARTFHDPTDSIVFCEMTDD